MKDNASRSLLVNFIYNNIYQILLLIIPLITAPYITRVFDTQSLGEYTYSFTVSGYFVIFAMLGINNYGNRCIAQVRDDKEKLSQVFSEIYTLQILSSVISIIVYLVIVLNVSNISSSFAFVNLLYVGSSFFDINWLLFGLEKFKFTVIRNLIIKTVLTCCIFIFIKNNNDILLYCFLIAASYIITNLSIIPYVKRFVSFKFCRLNSLKKHIKPSLILFIPVIAVSIYKYMDKIMLGNMISMTEVTMYEYSERINSIPAGVYGALGTVMFPRITNLLAINNHDQVRKYTTISLKLIAFIMPAMAFGLSSIAPEFSRLYYGKGYDTCGLIIQAMNPMLIFISANNVIRTQVLLPYERDRAYVVALIMGAVGNIVCNLILIPRLGAVGASVGTVIAEIVVFIFQMIWTRDVVEYKEYFKVLIPSCCYGLFMFVVLRHINIISDPLAMTAFRIIIGIIFYLIPSLIIYRFIIRGKAKK